MPGLSLHDLLHTPFYEGGGVSDLVPRNFPIAISGHAYMIDVRRYQRRTLPAQSDQFDQSSEPGEASLSREGFWRRSQSRFDHGAGQEFLDEEGADRRRFLESKGIDIWSNDRSMCLLNGTELKAGTNAPGTSSTKVLSVGGYLYVADGTALKFTADPSVASPTWTSITTAAAITDIATDGWYVYIGHNASAVERALVGAGSLTTWGTATAQVDVLGFSNGRLFGAKDNVISEIAADGTGSAIRTDPRTTGDWVAMAGSPSAMFAAFNAGSRGEIYAFTIDDVGASIGNPTLKAELPSGETVNALTYYGGTLLIGTSKGLRAAIVDGTDVNLGELIEVAEADGGVRCFATDGRFAWFGWTDYDSNSTGVGRADLASNTSEDTFVPAYASDVMAGVSGSATQGNVLAVARHGSRTYFVVASSGLWGETGNLVESGTLNSGWVRFSTLIPKLFSGVQIGTEALAGTVAVAIEFNDGTERSLGSFSTVGATATDLFDSAGSGVAARVELTLTRDTVTVGPCVHYWTLHALPRPGRVREFIVPLLIYRQTVDLVGKTWLSDPLAEIEYLEGLLTSNELVTYQEGETSWTVRVDNVAVGEGDIEHWAEQNRGGGPDRFWFDGGVVTVRLLSKEED